MQQLFLTMTKSSAFSQDLNPTWAETLLGLLYFLLYGFLKWGGWGSWVRGEERQLGLEYIHTAQWIESVSFESVVHCILQQLQHCKSVAKHKRKTIYRVYRINNCLPRKINNRRSTAEIDPIFLPPFDRRTLAFILTPIPSVTYSHPHRTSHSCGAIIQPR